MHLQALGFQKLKQRDPIDTVDSMATVSIPQAFSQRAKACKSAVKALKQRTS